MYKIIENSIFIFLHIVFTSIFSLLSLPIVLLMSLVYGVLDIFTKKDYNIVKNIITRCLMSIVIVLHTSDKIVYLFMGKELKDYENGKLLWKNINKTLTNLKKDSKV